MASTGVLVSDVESVFENKSRPVRHRLIGKDLRAEIEDLFDGGQPEVLDQEADVVSVPAPRGEYFMARRCSGEAAATRRPGSSKTRGAVVSPPGAT